MKRAFNEWLNEDENNQMITKEMKGYFDKRTKHRIHLVGEFL